MTLAINNPTPIHADENNLGLTGLVAVDASPNGEKLKAGSHLIQDSNFDRGLVVSDSKRGLLFIGDYTRVLHGNLATQNGSRFILVSEGKSSRGWREGCC